MSLQDIVRDQTRSIRDLLAGTEKEIEDCRRKQRSAVDQEKTLKWEASELRPGIAEQEETLRGLQLKVQEVERQIEELQERLRARREDQKIAETALQRRRQKLSDKTGEAKRVRKSAEDWDQKAVAAEERAQGYRARLEEERRAALRKHLTELWSKLIDGQREADDRTAAVTALQKLNRARHEDISVADLWESRQEWRRISESAGPEAVRKTARSELQRIENELDMSFPGALKAASTTLDELEEIHFYPQESGVRCVVLLPIPEEVCRSLDNGETAAPQDLAARVIWAFASAFPATTDPDASRRARFKLRRGFLELHVDQGGTELIEHDAIVLSLSHGCRVSFMISELPQDVTGAMRDGNPNG